MIDARCARCGCRMTKKDLTYCIRVEMVADYGDWVSDLQDKVLEHMDGLFHPMGKSQVSAKESYEEICFILCKGCVDQFLRNPLGGKNRFASLKTGQSHLLH